MDLCIFIIVFVVIRYYSVAPSASIQHSISDENMRAAYVRGVDMFRVRSFSSLCLCPEQYWLPHTRKISLRTLCELGSAGFSKNGSIGLYTDRTI